MKLKLILLNVLLLSGAFSASAAENRSRTIYVPDGYVLAVPDNAASRTAQHFIGGR